MLFFWQGFINRMTRCGAISKALINLNFEEQ